MVPIPSQATLAAQNGAQLPSAAPQPPPQPNDSLFRFTIDVRLKKTTGQRIDSAEKLGLHVITLNDWTSIKRRIWEICAPSLQPMATYTGEPLEWNLSPDAPTIDLFEKYIAMRIETVSGPRNLTMWQTDHEAHKALAKYREKTISISAYKWGNELSTGSQYMAFSKACLESANTDRSGAAAEAEQLEVIRQMQSQWPNLEAPQMVWRIWASEVCALPDGQRAREISRGPTKFIKYFRTTSSSTQAHILRLKRNCRLAIDLVDGAMLQFHELHDNVVQQRLLTDARMDAFEAMLRSKRETIEAYAEDLDPHPDDLDVIRVLGAIPSQDNCDHS
ncbi:hypothetical protein LEN26_000224 [Aphanomyces euteiches]|nr:hypothetical protein AeMF1_011717 [Aphanomyces euteiches]KAH9164054.1 hypothetical protein LEN26_000224 [Aphanomyces euteiches]KAH9182839.1 hypothetical protein AeNC1_015185 [Aphanomyces euteiches]